MSNECVYNTPCSEFRVGNNQVLMVSYFFFYLQGENFKSTLCKSSSILNIVFSKCNVDWVQIECFCIVNMYSQNLSFFTSQPSFIIIIIIIIIISSSSSSIYFYIYIFICPQAYHWQGNESSLVELVVHKYI